jgi:hypothetical protein
MRQRQAAAAAAVAQQQQQPLNECMSQSAAVDTVGAVTQKGACGYQMLQHFDPAKKLLLLLLQQLAC